MVLRFVSPPPPFHQRANDHHDGVLVSSLAPALVAFKVAASTLHPFFRTTPTFTEVPALGQMTF